MNGTDDHSQDPHPPASGPSAARRRAEQRERAGPREHVTWDQRETGRRLHERWAPEPTPRPMVGERLAGARAKADGAVRELKPKQPVRPGPNAPLLMRIVRSPYALHPVKHVRATIRDLSVVPEPREILGQPGRAWRELRAELSMPNPIRAFPHRPEPRPRRKSAADTDRSDA